MKYRKKPVVIDAEKWDGKFNAVVRQYIEFPTPGIERCKHCGLWMQVHGWIDTLEGGHIVCPGDWVITGVVGERYPCKDSIFKQTYEPVEEKGSS